MHRLKRWLRRIGIALAAVVVALTIASVIFNLATNGRDAAASTLYPGPYARVDGPAAYRAWGSHGTPVILLGGFIEPSWVWHEVGPLLGRSTGSRARPPALRVLPAARPVHPLAVGRARSGIGRQLGLRRPLLVGHSLGAAVAVTVATDAPRGVAGVVLLDGDARPGGGGATWLSHLLLPPWYTSLYRIATDWEWLFRRGLATAWGPDKPPFTPAFVEQWERPFRVTGTASAFASMLSHGIQGVSVPTLVHLRPPALVAWGAHDDVDSVAAGRQTAELLHAPFVEIPGAGHLSMLAQPALVAAAIERGERRSRSR